MEEALKADKTGEFQVLIGTSHTFLEPILTEKDVGEKKKDRLLLHSCCGPCSTAVIERLSDDYNITVFFYNPNITEEKEYVKRRDNQKLFIKEFSRSHGVCIDYLEMPYENEIFFQHIKGFEKEPEGGLRCNICFNLRLEMTARLAKEMNFDFFATTLTVSPHKSYPQISALGNELMKKYGVGFLDLDFKKKAGFQRSIELSKEYELYRQKYCGCIFSKWFDDEEDKDKNKNDI